MVHAGIEQVRDLLGSQSTLQQLLGVVMLSVRLCRFDAFRRERCSALPCVSTSYCTNDRGATRRGTRSTTSFYGRRFVPGIRVILGCGCLQHNRERVCGRCVHVMNLDEPATVNQCTAKLFPQSHPPVSLGVSCPTHTLSPYIYRHLCQHPRHSAVLHPTCCHKWRLVRPPLGVSQPPQAP
jgi:hypothetical protein